MIHTFKLFFELNYAEVKDIQRKFSIVYTKFNQHFHGVFPGVTMSISLSKNGKWRLYMVVDAIKLLGKADIMESDYVVLENKIRNILYNIFGHASHYNDHILLRIDYRYDAVVKDKDNQMLLMHLYRKLTKSRGFQKKYLGKIEDDVYIPYETTVYHSSKSIECMVYIKEVERIANGEVVESYEKDVVRYEVHVERDHLYYMAMKEKNPRPRKLGEYVKGKMYKEYFQKYMSQIYNPGSFRTIDKAREVMKGSSLTNQNKAKLIKFLKQVSSYSLDTPKKDMASATYKKRLCLLKQVGINPVPIPKNHSSKSPSTLSNPLDKFPW